MNKHKICFDDASNTNPFLSARVLSVVTLYHIISHYIMLCYSYNIIILQKQCGRDNTPFLASSTTGTRCRRISIGQSVLVPATGEGGDCAGCCCRCGSSAFLVDSVAACAASPSRDAPDNTH